jgi:hypothetical protein
MSLQFKHNRYMQWVVNSNCITVKAKYHEIPNSLQLSFV